MSERVDTSVNRLSEGEAPKKPFRFLEDNIANELADDTNQKKGIIFEESKLNNSAIDSYMNLPIESISWKNGEFLKQAVDDILLIWSNDKAELGETTRLYGVTDFPRGELLIFMTTKIEKDRYYFDFKFRRFDGSVVGYSLNFPRRKEIFEALGEVDYYLKQIVAKEEKFNPDKKGKPWHVSQ